MSINRYQWLIPIVVCFSVIALTTCGKDSPTKPKPPEPPPPPPVVPVATRIEITPSSATLNSIGQTVRLTARVFDQNNNAMAGATVTWSSSDVSVAGVNTQGLVTAVKNGTTVITARSGNASATANVTVFQSAGSIAIAPQMATLMSLGAKVQLTATVLDGNGQPVTDATVTWESSDEAVATVSAQGLVTAVNNGVARVTATSGSATAGIDVRVMQSAGSIVIAPMEATLMSLGATVQLTATVLDQNGQSVEDAVVTWQSGDEAVATVSAQGLVTAVMNGTARVMATSGAATSGIDVTVMQSAGSIVIAPLEATLMSLGATVQLEATVLDGNGQPVAGAVVTWQSNDDAIATVSAQGLVTAVTNGVTRVTATSGAATSGIDVTVLQSAGSIVIAPMEATLMSLGATVQLEATVLDGNGQPVAGAVVTWQSSDELVATVSVQGLVTAVNNGVTRVTATSGSATSGIDVTVMQSAGSIVIAPMEATLMSLGAKVQLDATVLDGNGQPVAGAVVTWQSSDEAVAAVSAQGLVTAVMNGVTRIWATSGSAMSSIAVKVMQSAGSIVIAPEMATLMSLGATVQLTATVLDDNGQPVEEAVMTWQSSDEAVATVSAQGLVTAVKNGVARITATSGGATAGIDVTVMQSAGSIVIAPMEATLMSLGATVQLEATVLDGNGQPVEGAVVTWQSSDEAVAAVSAQGLVTAVMNGVTRIWAISGSAMSSIAVKVMQSAGSIVIAPMEATLMSLGATVQLEATVLDGNGQPVAGAVVTWQSSDELVATVSVQGLVTALMNGTARVTATSGSATAGIDVRVMQSAGSIVIAPMEATLMSLGAKVQLTATVLDGNGQPVEGAVVTWQSSDEAVAAVSAQGLVTAVGNGVSRITATSGSALAGIDVTVMQTAGSIVIAPMEATLMSLGAKVQLTATVLDGNGQPVAGAVVTWQSSDELVATVSVQGLVTALMNGTARVTATSGSATAGIDVRVMQSAGSIVIAPMEATLMSLGAKVQLTATVLDGNGQPVAGAVVTWQSSDELVATVSVQGLVTAVTNGVTRVTATSGSATSGIDVTVMQSAVSIVIAPMEATLMSLGATVQLEATVLDGNGQPVAGAVVTWQSSDEAVATVSAEGLVTAVMNGVTRIWATSGSAMSSIAVKVMQSAGSIVIASEEATLMSLGATLQLEATVLDGNGQPVAGAVVMWSSGDALVATVNADGLVTAVGNGVVRITATSGSASAGIDVSVMQSAGSIAVEPEMATLMSLGETVQLEATVLDGNGQPVAGAVVRWQSSDEAVATVSAQGLVTAVANGVARVTATSGSASAGIDVTVMQSAGSIVIAPDEATLMSLGATVQLTATVLDQNGQSVEDAVVTWQSSDEAVATVSALGLVTAVKNGVTRITATSGDVLASIGVSVHIRMPSPDRNVLVALYNAMDGPNWTNNTNWLSENRHVDDWFGVNTDEEGRVTALNLGNNGLIGQLPVALSQLSSLEGLALENNRLTGTIPPELGQLTNLSLLYLFDNQLTGSIPTELSQLINLIHLCLNRNQLTGSIPPELGRLKNLKWLHLHNNAYLTGRIPTSLTTLDLDALLLQGTRVCLHDDTGLENWVSGITDARIAECEGFDLDRNVLEALYRATNGPEWGRAYANWMSDAPLSQWAGVQTDADGKVVSLRLFANGLSGFIPPELSQLSNLVWLDFAGNQLNGSIPAELGRLANLEKLNLSSNVFIGPIPTELGQLSELAELRLSRNRLTGRIPAELGQLSRLTHLNLDSNRLAGSIPPELGLLTKLKNLWMQENELSGSIPSALSQATDLGELNLNVNQLTGSIPAEMGQLSKLKILSLSGNRLSGSIPPEIGQLAGLDILFLDANQLSGSIPPELGNMTGLQNLNLWNNDLAGSIPPEFGNLANLVLMELGSNNLTGNIPSDLGRQTKIRVLGLGDNRLNGSIPPELGQLRNLQWLELKNNQLTGGIPTEFGQLSNLGGIDLSRNNLSGPLPTELTRLRSLRHLNLAETELCVPSDSFFKEWLLAMDVTRVSFCETVVPDRDPLTSIYYATGGPNWINSEKWLSDEDLEKWFGVTTNESFRVEELNLSSNNLVGRIPLHIGRLSQLRVLDLADNPSLQGSLPQELIGLSLATLRLDGTQLCVPTDDRFQEWLTNIPMKSGVLNCEEKVAGDRGVLIDFFNLTNGQNWYNSTNWLSEKSLGEWHGVSVDHEEHVTELRLIDNNLTGSIPSDLSKLTQLQTLVLFGSEITGSIPPEIALLRHLKILNLSLNQLTGSIPSELGKLKSLEEIRLDFNNLTGVIPPELGELENLTRLQLTGNKLTGGIPAELGQLNNLLDMRIGSNPLSGTIPLELGELTKLEVLKISDSGLTGSIPAELGNLANLSRLNLKINSLTGEIPPELGELSNLHALELSVNELMGSIPAELGKLAELRSMVLELNQLTGSIPSELGQLSNLDWLNLSNNRLSGSIPVELGQMTNLNELNLYNNQLMGKIPPELGQLTHLLRMNLSANRLEGKIPPEFGELENLESLVLSGNEGLAGSVPVSLIRLELGTLLLEGTLLCTPIGSDFQVWYESITNRSKIVECRTFMNAEVYITQAVQSFQRPVPLVEGEPALLRVFFATEEGILNRPTVKAYFYLNGAEEFTVDIPAGPAKIPNEITEGFLDVSSNATVPAEVISPGLELVVEINPGGMIDPESGIAVRVPETGRLSIDVQSVPPLHLTLVPMLSIENPNYEIVSATDGLTIEDDLFREIRDLLPVQDQDFKLTIHKPVLTSLNPHPNNGKLTVELEVIRAMEGASGHYMGIVGLGDRGGIANKPGFTSVSVLNSKTMAHELGHNFDLNHAPCGVSDVDPFYPYGDGSIGAWGYDLQRGALMNPSTPDIMGYCFTGAWISDYHFNRAINYRIHEEEHLLVATAVSKTRSLLLWGGMDENAELFLEPAFVVDASPSLPRESGSYRLEGEDIDGNVLFTMDLAMNEIADGDGSGFAFAIPVRPDWSDQLTRITLSGPGGFEEITRDSGRSAALLLDQSTGQVRGILRDWPDATSSVQAARRVLPEPGLEVVISSGIPNATDWER